jgi:hypothetical protein
VDAETARGIAYHSHHGRRDRLGELWIERVARVAAAVPPSARTTAWLCDVRGQGGTDAATLRAEGLTVLEEQALDLLTRGDDERFELHMLRIAHAPGPAGDVARAIARAELDDLLARAAEDPDRWDRPPYAWARRHIAAGMERPASFAAAGQRPVSALSRPESTAARKAAKSRSFWSA